MFTTYDDWKTNEALELSTEVECPECWDRHPSHICNTCNGSGFVDYLDALAYIERYGE